MAHVDPEKLENPQVFVCGPDVKIIVECGDLHPVICEDEDGNPIIGLADSALNAHLRRARGQT